MRRKTLLLTPPCVLMLMLVLNGCGAMGGDEYDPPAANILELRVEPDPVVVGDTVTFTCVVERNAPKLEFWWDPPGIGNQVISDVNQYRWVAEGPPGDYRLRVQVKSPGEPYEDVQSAVSFTVTAQD